MPELSSVRSITRGRLRLRDARLKGLGEAAISELTGTFTAREGVLSAAVNPANGSLLLLWNEAILSREEALGMAAALLPEPGPGAGKAAAAGVKCSARAAADGVRGLYNAGLDRLAPVVAPKARGRKRARRIVQNRLLMGAMGATVLSLAVRGGGLHTACGMLMLSLLSAHLYDHRRTL